MEDDSNRAWRVIAHAKEEVDSDPRAIFFPDHSQRPDETTPFAARDLEQFKPGMVSSCWSIEGVTILRWSESLGGPASHPGNENGNSR